MFDKINITKIIVDHISTFKDQSTKTYRKSDFVLFFGLPTIVTGVLIYYYGNLSEELIAVVATSLTIFTALLFNLLLLVYDAIGKSGSPQSASPYNAKLREQFLREVFSNISFAILIAISSIVLVLALILVSSPRIADCVLSGAIFFLVTLFLLTLLMLLKRVHILVHQDSVRRS